MMCKLKGWMDSGRELCANEKVDINGGIMMCKLNARMEKGGHI